MDSAPVDHDRPLAAWLLRQLPPADAERVLQQVLLKAQRSADRYKGGSYRAWHFRVARPALAEWIRRHGTHGPMSKHARAVESSLAELNDHERELVRARFDTGDHIDWKTPIARLRDSVERRVPGTTLLLPTMPDDAAELARWLERHIAGPDLGRLIAELSAVHGPSAKVPDLAAAFESDLATVVSGGLGDVSEVRLRALLRHPSLLAELQDMVAEAASPHWDELFDHPTLAQMAHRVRRAIAQARTVRRTYREPVFRRPWFVMLATTVLILGTVLLHRPRTARPWGWNRPAASVRGTSRDEHLIALAEAADEWRDRPKETAGELRRALKDMRDGCTAILVEKHSALPPADRAWLLERCVVWGARLDRHLADLQSGRSVADVRAEADETLELLIEDLRARANA